jgi:major membrane immunogen (membrane-anchored lipoprotein)
MRLILFLSLMLLIGCTSSDRTTETLEKAGYTDIQTGGYDWFGCSEDDDFKTKFQANNPQGQMVSGTVCCGLLKGCTIRF